MRPKEFRGLVGGRQGVGTSSWRQGVQYAMRNSQRADQKRDNNWTIKNKKKLKLKRRMGKQKKLRVRFYS